MPKISVILCAYNAEQYLSDAVNSVLGQTFKDLELIIVNDGSCDSTLAVALQFCQRDPRVKLVNIENGGLSNARNVGIGQATGDFIAFCDADDTIDSGCFETMYEAVCRDATDMVICGYHHDTVKKDGSVSTVDVFEPSAVYYTREQLFDGIVGLKSKFILDASWNKLYRKKIIDENNLLMPKGELFEDTAFVLSFLECSSKVSVLSDCFYRYMQRSNGSITKRYDERKLSDLKKRYRQLKEFVDGADTKVKRFVEFYYVKNVYSTLSNSFDCKDFTRRQRNELFKTELKSDTFLGCVKSAEGYGFADKVTVFVAKCGFIWFQKFYCKAIWFLKRRAAVLFAKIK